MANAKISLKFSNQDFWNLIFIFAFVILFLTFTYVFLLKRILIFFNMMDLLLISIATFRLVRLFTYDKIMHFFRNLFKNKKEGPLKAIHEMLICPWCTGIWAALISVVLYSFLVGKIFVIILAVAGIGSFIQVLANLISRIGKRQD